MFDRDPLVASQSARLGFGAWAVGGRGWGESAERSERLATVRRALELGITFFDTAPTYGGSETLLGEALADQRDSVAMATKVGPQDDPRASLERSLRALGTDRVDLFQLHEVGEGFERSLEGMTKLREEGKTGAIGICNAGVAHIRRALELAPIESVQDPYNLFDREVERDVLPRCRERGLAFLAYRPLASGLLASRLGSGHVAPVFAESDHRRRIYWFRGRELERRRTVLRRLQPMAEQRGTTLAALALGWALGRPGISTVLAGARTAEQVEENSTAAALALSPEEIDEIDEIVADAFRPPRATERARARARSLGERERFIVERLDGRASYEEIADEWPGAGPSQLLTTAQVKTFADQLLDEELAVEDELPAHPAGETV